MNANPEVMPPAANSSPRPNPAGNVVRDPRATDVRAKAPATPGEPRVSEDPMRRTDRYRLVMPWSSRV
ncbi:MAG: hypothetical protein WAT39_16555 [Planctomycetota bacterium]